MTGTPSRPSLARRTSLALTTFVAATVAVGSYAGVVHADENKCPPGSWFCADAEVKIGVPGTAAPAPPPPVEAAPAPAPPPPIVIYTPAPPPQPVYTAPPPAYYPPPPPPPRERPKSEIGLNFRLVGAAYGRSEVYRGDTGGGGLGASLRFRPTPRFALDIGFDHLRGTDANGYKRTETPLSLLGLLYLNPRSKAQVYLLGGFGYSSARVEVTNNGGSNQERYTYFGAFFGGGLEFRVGKKVALNFDVRGFVRGRTDDEAARKPEFTSLDGRTTNTSGGALFTGGLTFYF